MVLLFASIVVALVFDSLIDELNRTFVTPIDREDIFALSRAIDDSILANPWAVIVLARLARAARRQGKALFATD